MARKLINTIARTWRPVPPDEQPRTQLTRRNPPEIALSVGELAVDNQANETDLENSIRVFTDKTETTNEWEQDKTEQAPDDETIVYTDGSCLGNGTAEARAGSGVWFGNNDPRNAAIRVPGKDQSNQIGELLAVLAAVKKAPRTLPLRICSDSKFAIEGLTKHARDWEARDWIGIKHGQLFKCVTAWIRARQNTTTLQWVKGHAGITGNEEADKLAAEGTRGERPENTIDLRAPRNTTATGAKLNSISQTLTYHHLKGKGEITRRATSRSLRTIEEETKEVFGLTPTTEAIWRSMGHRDISRKTRDFLWKHAHGLYRLGSFWNNIEGYEERGVCPLCQQTETFQHILQECCSKERETIWEAANNLWKTRYRSDLPTTEGAVLGCGLANFTKEDGKPDAPKNRLYRILISESAHLIWVLRPSKKSGRSTVRLGDVGHSSPIFAIRRPPSPDGTCFKK